MDVLDFSRRSEGRAPPFLELDVEIALEKLKRPCKLDGQGICVDLLRIAFEADPDMFIRFLRSILGSEKHMSTLASPMHCFGKVSSNSTLKDLRGIIPPSTLLRLLDRLLAVSLEAHLYRIIPAIPGCYVGARRCTQTRDLGHGIALLVEKGLDDRGRASMVQGDVARYFDSLPVLRIVRWLFDRHVDIELLSAIVRHQLLTQIHVCRGGS